jgi:uncharacterized protein (TIGR03437 family)
VAFWILIVSLHTAYAAGPFSTFLKENSSILGVGHDPAGNLYVYSSAIDGSRSITRLNSSASRIDYTVSTSGSSCNAGNVAALDAAGNVFIAGTESAPYNGYPCVLKFDASGKLVYSFAVEQAAKASVQAIAIDSDGSAVLTGIASELGFPSTPGGFTARDSSLANFAVVQPFIARIDPAGSSLLASAVGVGGRSVAIGPRGDIFVSGGAAGFGVGNGTPLPNSYPITPGAFQSTFTPSIECSFPCQLTFPSSEQYVTRLDAALTRLIYSTYVTGSHGATNQALAVDSAGNAYVTGTTLSTDYPYTPNQPTPARATTFLTKLDPTGSKLVWSVQQGGSLLVFDADGNLILGGSVYPAGGLPYQLGVTFPPPPATGNLPAACLPTGLRAQIAAAVQRVSAADGRILATQLLPATSAQPTAMDVLGDGRVLVGGSSTFPDVPITPGTLFSSAIPQRTPSGAFLAAFDLATSALGGRLACVADGLTNMPLGPVSPGQLISIFGTNFGAPGSNTTVTFDGVAAPLTYLSPGQINLGVPWELMGETSTVMRVNVDGAAIAARQFAVAASNPSVFVDTGGSVADGNSFFPAIALNSDGTKNSRSNPAKGGSLVTLFLNGVSVHNGNTPPVTGSVSGDNPAPIDVPIAVTAGTLTLESGPLMPWPDVLAGLYQVQTRVPGSDVARAVALTVTVGGVPAGPFVYFGKVYQAGALVWVN